MVAKKRKSGKAGARTKVISHRQHGARIVELVGIGADGFVETNSEKISSASKEECALRGYTAGMLDMISLVREAIGFWGAEQVREEMERRCVNGGDMEGGSSKSTPSSEDVGTANTSHGSGKSVNNEAACAPRGRRCADPMFA